MAKKRKTARKSARRKTSARCVALPREAAALGRRATWDAVLTALNDPSPASKPIERICAALEIVARAVSEDMREMLPDEEAEMPPDAPGVIVQEPPKAA